ncbi:hypothetical protein VTO73DRAFT_2468 [Trametes versicolor]
MHIRDGLCSTFSGLNRATIATHCATVLTPWLSRRHLLATDFAVERPPSAPTWYHTGIASRKSRDATRTSHRAPNFLAATTIRLMSRGSAFFDVAATAFERSASATSAQRGLVGERLR